MPTLNLNKFVLPNDPILTRIAEKIDPKDIHSAEFKKTIEEMFLVAFGEQKDVAKPLLVGLAAPQIGISKRIILVDVMAMVKVRWEICAYISIPKSFGVRGGDRMV